MINNSSVLIWCMFITLAMMVVPPLVAGLVSWIQDRQAMNQSDVKEETHSPDDTHTHLPRAA